MSGCWLWTLGVKDGKHPYGKTTFKGKPIKSHRLSYILHKGAIPDGMHVLHICDNPICCNPDHLYVGTHADNMRDMDKKGRREIVRGESVGTAKLSSQDVSEIKSQLIIHGKKYGTLTRLGKQYGVSHKAIQLIRDGRNWAM